MHTYQVPDAPNHRVVHLLLVDLCVEHMPRRARVALQRREDAGVSVGTEEDAAGLRGEADGAAVGTAQHTHIVPDVTSGGGEGGGGDVRSVGG